MTCYQRHLGWLFEALDEPLERDRKKAVHAAIADAVGLTLDSSCPEVWNAVKEHYGIDAKSQSAELVADVQARLAG